MIVYHRDIDVPLLAKLLTKLLASGYHLIGSLGLAAEESGAPAAAAYKCTNHHEGL